ncbi:cellulose binding domain-containing protein [Actinoplanes sp. TRM 88003]|uniref:Cellulose binding domain-containing protein n=1 Tax=Paractinoplanes aksuensis TaxID=2939490 RepID=A0ABT1DZF3_9ACTN|nr:cellulose binding domain-containing protein [Actinoplanes aksuensis]MCO8276260.1 cellulose binding domain-containing protein [Actinoplanes aksuensis]
MRLRIGAAILFLVALVGGPAGAAAASEPTPTPTCPPALPLSGSVAAATTESLTISYWILFTPPCGYNPPVTVTLFDSSEDARQWIDPVAEAVSGPERNGAITVAGLTAGTQYWYRFSADGKRDPYLIGSGRTAAAQACAATVTIGSAWTGGFVATVSVRNTGSEPLAGWHVSWRWAGDERIESVWNGVAQSGADGVTISNASWNGALPVGGSTTFGLLAASGAPPVALTPTCAG